ncbi:hypothetical protein FQN50_009763 [Emmonsiellopsis sp. PD_5]|nr:hypothetical protein FQN50_009763 [Emmonsiellopsis sp. PD_5]
MQPIEALRACVEAIQARLAGRFILIGGAAMAFQGSGRLTEDVDILVATSDLPALQNELRQANGFSEVSGKIFFTAEGTNVPVDILTNAVQKATFEEMLPYTTLVGQVRVLRLDYALGAKLTCLYLRQDDDNGMHKRKTDARDITFLCTTMAQCNDTISDECAQKFRLGFYHMAEIRLHVPQTTFDILVRLGIRNMLIPWEHNTPEQQEYYSCLAEPGSDPLTVPLEDLQG